MRGWGGGACHTPPSASFVGRAEKTSPVVVTDQLRPSFRRQDWFRIRLGTTLHALLQDCLPSASSPACNGTLNSLVCGMTGIAVFCLLLLNADVFDEWPLSSSKKRGGRGGLKGPPPRHLKVHESLFTASVRCHKGQMRENVIPNQKHEPVVRRHGVTHVNESLRRKRVQQPKELLERGRRLDRKRGWD